MIIKRKSALIKKILPFFFLFALTANVFAWNALGHEVISQIAYKQLDKSTQARVNKLIAYLNLEYPEVDSLDTLSVWPQTLTQQGVTTFTNWHYVRTSYAPDSFNVTTTLNEDNAIWALERMQIALGNSRANNYERARFLALFVHIVGDMHQPLHTMSLYNQTYTTGDQGGMLYNIIVNRQPTNLHQYWDNGGGLLTTEKGSEALAREIIAVYPAKQMQKKINRINPQNWLQEENALAKDVYSVQAHQAPSAQYEAMVRQMSEEELALAGYRLAKLLNTVLG